MHHGNVTQHHTTSRCVCVRCIISTPPISQHLPLPLPITITIRLLVAQVMCCVCAMHYRLRPHPLLLTPLPYYYPIFYPYCYYTGDVLCVCNALLSTTRARPITNTSPLLLPFLLFMQVMCCVCAMHYRLRQEHAALEKDKIMGGSLRRMWNRSGVHIYEHTYTHTHTHTHDYTYTYTPYTLTKSWGGHSEGCGTGQWSIYMNTRIHTNTHD